MLLMTLRGTPTCYYGDEIGMRDVKIPPERVQDPQGAYDPDYNRDPARTPMQWDASPNAGFCPEDTEPWLPVANDHDAVNVNAQHNDPLSMLTLFRNLIELRREMPPLVVGSYRPLKTVGGSIHAYLREHKGQQALVVLNFSSEPTVLDLSEVGQQGEVLCSTCLDRIVKDVDLRTLDLRANEGLIVSLEPVL